MLLPCLRQVLQSPVVLCGKKVFEFCCLVCLDGSLSAGDGLWFQGLLLCPLFLEPLHAGEGNAESLSDLGSCLSALQGIDDTLAKIEGERFHSLTIA